MINTSTYLVTLPLGLIMVPIMLHGLGRQFYGVWVLALAVSGWSVTIFDAGLSWSAMREVAASTCPSRRYEAARFVAVSRRLYIWLALIGALLIAVVGVVISGTLRLPVGDLAVSREGFAIVALTFVPSQLATYESYLLQGLRRFDLSNILSVSVAVLNALGIIGVLALGFGLLAVFGVQALVTALFAIVAYLLVTRIEPNFRLSATKSDWKLIKSRLEFSLGSELITALSAVSWEGAPLFIGPVLGSAAVAQFHIGRKLPQMLTRLVWSGGAVVIPAAASASHVTNRAHLLATGTRWLFVVASPACLILGILAPNILAVWIGPVRPDTVLILRLITASALLQALCTVPFNILWGRGAIRVLLALMLPVTACNVGLTIWLMRPIGVTAAGWALLLPTLVVTVLSIYAASASCATSPLKVARFVSAGLALPLVICGLLALAAAKWVEPIHWLALIAICLASVMSYSVVLYVYGLSLEERAVLRSVCVRVLSLR